LLLLLITWYNHSKQPPKEGAYFKISTFSVFKG